MIILAMILGGLVYRWRGTDYDLRPLSHIVFALPYIYLSYTVSWWAAGIVTPITILAVLTGHGGFMDLGSWTKPRKDERLELIIKWLHGKIPEYWYDFIGLALTGLVITLPAGIATLNPLLAISGILKAPAYAVSRKTEVGEILTGAFLWGSCILFGTII